MRCHQCDERADHRWVGIGRGRAAYTLDALTPSADDVVLAHDLHREYVCGVSLTHQHDLRRSTVGESGEHRPE